MYHIIIAFTSEYAEDVEAFMYALEIGCITVTTLIVLRKIDAQVYLKRYPLRLYASLFGTPLTPVVAYLIVWFTCTVIEINKSFN